MLIETFSFTAIPYLAFLFQLKSYYKPLLIGYELGDNKTKKCVIYIIELLVTPIIGVFYFRYYVKLFKPLPGPVVISHNIYIFKSGCVKSFLYIPLP